MQTTTRPTYQQVHSMAMQLSYDDRMRLRESLYEDENEPCGLEPYTEAKLNEMMLKGFEDYKAGRCCSAEEGLKILKEKYPWLQE